MSYLNIKANLTALCNKCIIQG